MEDVRLPVATISSTMIPIIQISDVSRHLTIKPIINTINTRYIQCRADKSTFIGMFPSICLTIEYEEIVRWVSALETFEKIQVKVIGKILSSEKSLSKCTRIAY